MRAQDEQRERVEEFLKGECKVMKEGPPPEEEGAEGARRELMGEKKKLAGKGRRQDILYTSPDWAPGRPSNKK